MDAAAQLYNSPLFSSINKSTEEEEATYRPLFKSFDCTCGGSHAHASSSPVPKKHARAARLSCHHPSERMRRKSQQLRRQTGCLVAQGDNIWERNA